MSLLTRFARHWRHSYHVPLVILLVVAALLGTYAATLQTHISGSFQETTPDRIRQNEYIKDVAEIQVALNAWGTIHHTGYPLFAILGNLFTAPLRALGMEPSAAASLYALSWGVVMLAGFGLLLWRLTGRPALAALGVGLLGAARSIWLHHVIAEVYSMSLAITVLLILVALWPADHETDALHGPRRLYWLALLGGIGVAHHRAVVFIAPGLALAAWPDLREYGRRALPLMVGLGLLGFVPYVYLPLREWSGGTWVYGEPGTLAGFWTEFSGREADRLVTLPNDLAGLWENARNVWNILARELTLPGLLVGLAGLALAVTIAPRRHAARVIALAAAGPTLFATFYHTAVLPEAVLMPTVLALVTGVVLATDGLLRARQPAGIAALAGIAAWTGLLLGWHYTYIDELVSEQSGVQTIARIERHLPRDGQVALMLPWGPRHAAAAYARLVTGEIDDVLLVDHKGDYRRLLADGYRLFTEPETFYTYPPPWPTAYGAPSSWWTDRLAQLFLSSAAPGFVELNNTPPLADPGTPANGEPVAYGITRRQAWLTCDADSIYLHVIWGADRQPDGDPSIFVHLTGDEPAPNPPNADSRHPVYGLYPFARWSPGEVVRDDFTLPHLPDKTQVRFGLYEQAPGGGFTNYGELVLPVAACQEAAP